MSVKFYDKSEVTLLKASASDEDVAYAAWVSTMGTEQGEEEPEGKRLSGLINYLMKGRHGSPFEHTSFTWKVKTPIFVAREFHRHRIASYNEMSGRYMVLPGEVYVAGALRPLVNAGSSARPDLVEGTPGQLVAVQSAQRSVALRAWAEYQELLSLGVANEVARMHLPQNMMTQFWVTMNARALMNFLSLRVSAGHAMFPTHPLFEIEQVAGLLENDFRDMMPLTHAAFNNNGRVAP